MTVKIYLESPRKDRKGNERRIIFGITIPSGRFWIKTAAYIEEKHFNMKDQKFKIKEIHQEVHQKRKFLENLEAEAVRERVPLTKEYIRSKWNDMRGKTVTVEEKENKTFFEYFDYLQEKLKKTQGYGTIKNYSQVKRQLLAFNPKMSFDDITENFYDEYNDYLVSEATNRNTKQVGLSTNTIGKHWDKIRKVCKEAQKDGVQVSMVYQDYKSPSHRVPPLWLTKDEAQKLIDIELTSYNRIIRDEFLARYYTSLRTSDMDKVNKNSFMQINGGTYLRFTSVKTKKDLVIPLNAKALEIFEKYNYQFPDLPQQVKNRYIKDIAQEAEINTKVPRTIFRGSKRIEKVYEKWELISTHTARRSFGRRFMESVGDINQLREIMGHTDTRTTALYIGWEDQELSKSVNRINF